jgi:hypothetical protein
MNDSDAVALSGATMRLTVFAGVASETRLPVAILSRAFGAKT